MKAAHPLSMALAIVLAGQSAQAQHCAPITDSYLSTISVRHADNTLRFRTEFTKRGGQPKAKYQAYLLAYLDRNARKVPPAAPANMIDPNLMLVLHTQVIERTENGRYVLEFDIDDDTLAKKMIAHSRLAETDRSSVGGWGSYNDAIRVAVFIPFLQDETYSTLAELPQDKHECNYANERALLFQELPYALTIRFGIVDAVQLKPGVHRIGINGSTRPRL